MNKYVGLTTSQVEQSKKMYGTNQLSESKRETFLKKLMENFKDPIILILCFALLINVIFYFLGQGELIETIGIAIAILLATGIGTLSEMNNENAFQKLQEEASKILVKVYRNTILQEISINDIVVGDIVVVQTGDKIPGDGKVIDGNITVDQAALNGESKEAKKYAITPETVLDSNVDFLNSHKVYRGSIVLSGNAIIEITVVGNDSVYGKIASELQSQEERDTPLKIKLRDLAEKISKFGYIGGALIALAMLFLKVVIENGYNFNNIIAFCSDYMALLSVFIHAIMLAVIIIIMAVPEGLPLMIAIVSSLNMSKMLKDNVLVRKINGIETAGSLNILFSDKTGTITKGKLEVIRFITGAGNEYSKFMDITTHTLKHLLFLNIKYNSDATMSEGKVIGGNSSEKALLSFIDDYETDTVKKDFYPFNSADKFSSAKITDSGKTLTLFKGTPEKILDKCSDYLDEYGVMHKLDQKLMQEKITQLAQKAIRVLAIAIVNDDVEMNLNNNLTLIGLIGIRDDVRPEAITSIQECQNAGVQVVMVTGDRADTASAIAKEAGLITSSQDIILTSDELNKMSDSEVKQIIPNLKVVSRALPSDKSRLVKLAQDLNLVVGMTGDGVNDSPALKKADVGFGMGSGTEVAKEAADIVILDDNFKSITQAILYGRTIYNNIQKFIIFQLTINISAVLVSLVAPFLGIEMPLTIVQILWINLIMDTLAAIAFGGEAPLQEYMKEQPKQRNQNIVDKYMLSSILTNGIGIFVISMVFLLSTSIRNMFSDNLNYLTGYFTVFIFAAIFNAFNSRTTHLNLFNKITKNKGFIIVISLIAIIQIIMVYVGGEIMRCHGLTLKEWLIVLGFSIVVIIIDLVRKLLIGGKK